MNYEDFIRPTEEAELKDAPQIEEEQETVSEESQSPAEGEDSSLGVEVAVQKAVVESLAADKAEQSLQISTLRKDNNRLNSTILELKEEIAKLKEEISHVAETLLKNSEVEKPNQVTLLERNPDLGDKFEGETYDHVLEVLKEARDASEAAGRNRRAQVLEGVLVANESTGNLVKKREELKKLFSDNQNVINGQVINELDKLGIPYKVGETYLLVDEIIKRAY